MHDCSKIGRQIYLMTALFIAVSVFGCASTKSTAPAGPTVQGPPQAVKPMEITPVQPPVCQGLPVTAPYYPPPRIDFCGEHVPLEKQEVLEQFDKEFTLVVHNHAQVYWWLKRKDRYFPLLEERLRRFNLPDDLKYVALAELEPPLNAQGKKKLVDMRNDFELSPDSALQNLGDLYRSFRSWACAIVAYNSDAQRIMAESYTQGQKDCYQMLLPQETERYLFRILAIKAVLSDPTRYGYELPKDGR